MRGLVTCVSFSLFAMLALFFAPSLCAAAPQADNGLLDLSQWDFAADGTIKLDGEWAFYWRRLLAPRDFQSGGGVPPTSYIQVPGAWDGYEFEGKTLPGDGYATYRLRIRLEEQPGLLSISIPYASTAYKMWVDGAPAASNGTVGTNRGASKPQYLPQVVRFRPQGESVQLVVQVSNFHHRRGGLWNSLVLGTSAQIDRRVTQSLVTDGLLLGSFLIIAFYHFGLYLWRREDRSPLYFGLFSLLIAIRMLVMDEILLIRRFPDFPWDLQLRIEYFTAFVGLPMVALLLRALYPRDMSKIITRLAQGLGFAGGLAVWLIPVRLTSFAIPPYEVILALFIFYFFYVSVVAAVRQREGAALFLVGALAFFVGILHDLLAYNLVFITIDLIPLGLFIAILFQSFVLSNRFSNAFHRQAALTVENERLLQLTQRQLQELQRSRRMVTAREEALRREIAEMLHGRVQNRLLRAWHRLGECVNLWGANVPRAQALITEAREEIDEVRERDIRLAGHRLHPSIIQVGLLPAIRSLARSFQNEFEIVIEADETLTRLDHPVQNGLPEPLRLTVYRVLEEALHNVYKHAEADTVQLSLCG